MDQMTDLLAENARLQHNYDVLQAKLIEVAKTVSNLCEHLNGEHDR